MWTTWVTSGVGVLRGLTCTVAGSGQQAVRQATDLGGERRREEQVLTSRRQKVEDLADVPDEAHVEHAVRLVEDEHLDPRQVDGALGRVVEQTAGRGDHDVRTGAQRRTCGLKATPP
jgi:hypothetical protein